MDTVGHDPLVAVLHVDELPKPQHGHFGQFVGTPLRPDYVGADAAYIHDGLVATFQQDREERTSHEISPFDVDVETVPPVFRVTIGNPGDMLDIAGIVDQDIQSVKGLSELFGGLLDIIAARDVDVQGQDLWLWLAGLSGCVSDRCLDVFEILTRCDCDAFRAGFGERNGGGAADTFVCAGDEDDLA